MGPVLLLRGASDALSPRPGEHLVEQQHCHVAAHPISLIGDVEQRVGCRLSQARREAVELGDIGPRREEWIAPAGDDRLAHGKKAGLVAGEVVAVALHEEFGVVREPRVIGCHVIGDEVDEQAYPAFGQGGSRRGEALATTESPVDLVAADAVGRSDHVGGVEIGQDVVERRHVIGGLHGQLHARWAAFPNAHQPHGVDSGWRHLVPFLGRDISEGGGVSTGALADIVEPCRRVQLVDHGICLPLIHVASDSRLIHTIRFDTVSHLPPQSLEYGTD